MVSAESMRGPANAPAERRATIRFSHVDGAGIVFYPRYIELIAAAFPELPPLSSPSSIGLDFLKANTLGEEVTLVCEQFDRAGCAGSLSGRVGADEHFKVTFGQLATTEADKFVVHSADFCANPVVVAAWQVGPDERLHLSRYYELISEAVEQWFGSVLELPFATLHSINHNGIPTVSLKSRFRELPALGDSIHMRIRPLRIGRRSFAFRSWLMRGSEWLAENEQIVVFVSLRDQKTFSTDLPADLRARLSGQLDAVSS